MGRGAGSLLVVLHRRGREDEWAYGDGYCGFMAPVPPLRAICRTENDLERALALFEGSTTSGDRVLVNSAHRQLLADLSPGTIGARKQHGG